MKNKKFLYIGIAVVAAALILLVIGLSCGTAQSNAPAASATDVPATAKPVTTPKPTPVPQPTPTPEPTPAITPPAMDEPDPATDSDISWEHVDPVTDSDIP